MNYKIVNLNTSLLKDPKSSVLIIYTGGTFGMAFDASGSLAPFNFGGVLERIPEIKSLEVRITVISFPEPVDSSNINSKDWVDIAYIIYENYHQYDGFIVLHGTDTMAYSASALSYMLQGLGKPVIFTGAQIPIGQIRSDAKENLLTALEIASSKENGIPIIKEVCIYFNHFLLRGNRSRKIRSSTFAAFESENYPYLAESGVFIEYNRNSLLKPKKNEEIVFHKNIDNNVTILKLFPNIGKQMIEAVLNIENLKGVVLETYGSGNTPNLKWFLDCLERANDKGVILYNVSQCNGGQVIQGRYETSKMLEDIGVLSGSDITSEAAITKLMFLLGTNKPLNYVKKEMGRSLRGEMTV